MSRAEYDKSLDQIRTLDLGAIRQLDATGEDGSPLFELCLDPDEGPGRAAAPHRAARRCSPSAIRELPEREREILALYYEEELTMAEIGKVIGVVRVARVAAALAGAVAPARAACATRSGRSAPMSRDPLAGRDRRAADGGVRPRAAAAPRRRGRARSAGRRLQLPPSGSRLEGPDPLAALPARPLRAQRVDVAVGLHARRHRGRRSSRWSSSPTPSS